jgi:imidazolonepropionase-like amidohydrolase
MADKIRFQLANRTLEAKLTLVKADVLTPGRGEPQKDAALVCNQGEILFIGPQSEIPSEFTSLEALKVPVLIPGLWDCHVHFFGTTQYSPGSAFNLHQTIAGARTVRDAAELVNAGYTSVCECAGHGVHLDQVIEEGSFIGPKIYFCGALISQTGGHSDAHNIPLGA